LLACALAVACAPTVDYRGYVPDQAQIDSLSVGVDTKRTVETRLGTPSAMSTFDADTWYYVHAREERFAIFKPKITEAQILAVRFGPDQTVTAIDRFTHEDGRVVNFVDRKTPTRGKELTFLEQLFGNVGKVGPGIGSEE
ncbi:MAG: outer membrane protein assembly factor BamE, partial [Alphaproteobacteria bacterium]|nr:outer membrane protein assembly factor BamE [Alphaproteobacteria bacterium]